MNRSHTIAAGLVVGALTAPLPSAAEARPGADGAYPFKNTVYTGTGEVASQGYTLKVKLKVGANIKQVDKMVAKIRCPDGKQKFVRRNLGIDESGNIDWDHRDPEYFGGQFTTRHKVDRGAVQGDPAKPCSSYVLNFIAKD